MKGYKKHIRLSLLFCLSAMFSFAGENSLNLETAIETACKSSLRALSARNTFLSSYWQYRSYQAARLPSLTLTMVPLEYERTFTNRYDSEKNRDVFREQQSLYSYGNLSLKQNIDLTGGIFYLDSELGYVKNFGNDNNQQFSTVPIRLGYSHRLFGYNNFKWEKRIEPLNYEKAKKKLLFSMEEIAETAAQYFFALAMAKVEYDLSKASLASSDTLYHIGVERQGIASISQADLLTLKLDWVNAGNALHNAEINLKKAKFGLFSFLKMDKLSTIELELPDRPKNIQVTAEMALEQVKSNNPDLLANKQVLLEAEKNLEKTSKSSRMEANLDMSVGFNQAASRLNESYRNPLPQDIVSVSLNVPLLDWGVRKGKVNMAKNELNVTQLTVQQNELSLEEDIVMTVSDFNIQQNQINSAEEAKALADLAYDATKQRYLIGKADISSLTLARNRQENAKRNFVSSLQYYWLSYLKIRKLTLYDFWLNQPLSTDFEQKYGIH